MRSSSSASYERMVSMRQSGILLHLTSLPSPGGIGTLGREAYAFADFLAGAGMSVWQVLPISPTGFGDSPYQSVSTFAGNPLLIDFRMMMDEGFLPQRVLPFAEDEDPAKVDYGRVVEEKTALLKEAFAYSGKKIKKQLNEFRAKEPWVNDYALFSAVKEHFGLVSLMQWPDEDIRLRKPEALEAYGKKLKSSVDYYVFIQYLFFKQWYALKAYANRKGIQLFGDMPIYTAEDSCDVWAHPEVFQLDRQRRPTHIAGVPPDYFSATGQRWGNPLYNWARLKKDGYKWWLNRLRAMGSIYDIVRVDHFIGFANYYSIPASEETAQHGVWEAGPGQDFFTHVKQELPNLRIVAEDLGAVNEKVLNLMRFTGYPGMKVLCFAFSGNPADPYLPQNYPENCVVYTGTHDNSTVKGWFNGASDGEKAFARKILGISEHDDISSAMVRAALLSRGDTCVLPMQDILGLDDGARMNIPSTIGGLNWRWRMTGDQMTDTLMGRLKTLNLLAGRCVDKKGE